MDKLDGMTHFELTRLVYEANKRLAKFNPIRLRVKRKRCGKKGCFCMDGPSDGSWDNLHGPYLFAQYVDSETGKTRVKGLGLYYSSDQLDEVTRASFSWSDYFAVPDGHQTKDHTYYYDLSAREFEEYYGIAMEDDTMSRHTTYWATEGKSDAFDTEKRKFLEDKSAACHIWADKYGLGSVKGQRTLKTLLEGNYYLVD